MSLADGDQKREEDGEEIGAVLLEIYNGKSKWGAAYTTSHPSQSLQDT